MIFWSLLPHSPCVVLYFINTFAAGWINLEHIRCWHTNISGLENCTFPGKLNEISCSAAS